MNKKFLSAILFGALMVTSTGTFVSCKDYDDDIDRIDNTLNDLKSQIAALQKLVDNGDYVTGVAKTADGKGMTFTFSKGSPVTVTLDVKDGAQGEAGKDAQQVTVDEKTGELLIDNEGTGIFPVKDAAKAPVKAEGGFWYTLNAEGEYENTNIPVSGLSAVGSEADGWTLTIVGADGKTQAVKVPSAASLITSIVLRSDLNPQPFVISKATFAKPGKWSGKRELPADKSVIYSSSAIDIRINPVDAPATEVKYYLTNTKNKTLSNIILAATPESADNAITIGGINGRAANTGNGLFTLGMNQYVLSKDDAKAFDKDLTDNAKARNLNDNAISDYNNCIAFAINANNKTRSAYNVAIGTEAADDLTKIKVKGMVDSDATLNASTPAGKNITVVVGKAYTIEEISAETGLMYDMFFQLAEVDQKTYGVEYDDLAHTFTVTKDPDVSTAASGFDLTINTLSTSGTIMKGVYAIKLSSSIETPATYEPITYDIAQLKDNNASNDAFAIDMDIMKNALGDKWVQWANNVNLGNTAVAIHEKADCSDAGKAVGAPANGLVITLTASDKSTGATVNNLKYTVVKVNAQNADGLKLDKQYYLKVTFKNGTSTEINSIVVPVTFTAPTVASQFAQKAGYVVDGTINAYFYNTENKNIALNRYFDKYDANATITLDGEKEVKAKNNNSYRSNGLATLSAATMAANLTLNTSATDKDNANAVAADANTGKEFGYGETLTVKATNANYADTKWAYTTDSKKGYSFTIKVMSPIMEGTVKPAEGSTIKISANNTKGFDITKSMITGVDYNKNAYNVVPDKDVTSDPDNTVDNAVEAWDNEQIKNVYVTKKGGDTNTYIKTISLIGQKAKAGTAAAVMGAINVKADPLPNEQETAIIVNVKDAWGYTTSKEVSVTILKN